MNINEEFSRKFTVRKLPADGLAVNLVATAEECAALAVRLGILSCNEVAADLTLTAHEGGRMVRGEGRLRARVSQACVVSLEPVEQIIDEPVSLLFLENGANAAEEAVIDLDPDDEEVPDPIVRGVFDAGAPIAEILALALDPYPRRPNVEFQAPPVPIADREPSSKTTNPFAVLQALRGSGRDDANGNET